jgi:hypothetical protein
VKDIQEILSAISTFQNTTAYMNKKSRWTEDYNFYNLEPYDAGMGYLSYTSNAPRIFINKLIAMLNDSKLIIRVPIESLSAEERLIASNIERFLYGCFNLNDDQLTSTPATPTLRQQRAFFAALRGGFARCAYVYKDEKTGETKVTIPTWDLYNVAYKGTINGTSWAAHIRSASKEEIKQVYNVEIEGDEEKIVDFWDVENNGVILGGNTWVKKLTPHGLDYCPVTIHMVGANPNLYIENNLDINKNVGEGALKESRNLFYILNKVMSDYMTLTHRGVKTPLGVWSADGSKNIEDDIWQSEKAASVPFKIGEDIRPLLQPTMPVDAAALVQMTTGEIQRGTLPYTAYGELSFRLSGFAINQLQSSLQTVIEPFALCLEQAYRMDCKQLLQQYAKQPWEAIKVRGRTSYNTPFGMPKGDLIETEMLEPDWIPEISLTPVLPKDDAQRYQLAQLARQPNASGIPLLSDRTIQDELIGVQDPDFEARKIDQEWGDKLMVNRLWLAYIQALKDGDPNVQNNIPAQNLLAELRRLMGQNTPTGQAGNKVASQPSPTGQMSLETAGVGLPPEETGVPSSTMPVEAMGGVPPGASNATPNPTGGY